MDEQWHSDEFKGGSDYANGRYLERAHNDLMNKLSGSNSHTNKSSKPKPAEHQKFWWESASETSDTSSPSQPIDLNWTENDSKILGYIGLFFAGLIVVDLVATHIGTILWAIFGVGLPALIAVALHSHRGSADFWVDALLGAGSGAVMYYLLGTLVVVPSMAMALYLSFIFGLMAFLFCDRSDRLVAQSSGIKRGIYSFVQFGTGMLLMFGYILLVHMALDVLII